LSEALFVTIGNVEFEFRDLDLILGWDVHDGSKKQPIKLQGFYHGTSVGAVSPKASS
jgi:hypothetical protein